jgi:hypothetical protein
MARHSVMIGLSKTFYLASWSLLTLVTTTTGAQSTPQAVPAMPKAAAVSTTPWRQRTLRFSEVKPILGLPRQNLRSSAHCSEDGTTFVAVNPESTLPNSLAVPELFRVSPNGEIIDIHRKIPLEFTDISVKDFFVAEDELVTLLEAVKRDEHDETAAPRETSYFLSLSDHDGDNTKLLQLDLKFKPLKVAMFGPGDFIVLGWDEINLLPVLVLLKDDGTIRHFIDLEDRSHSDPYATYGSLKEAESSATVRSDLAILQRTQFVPYGSQVLLTYPGTARSIRILSPVGEDRSIPVELPGGFVLHDVLVSGARYPLVLRAQVVESSVHSASAEASTKPRQRLFEFDAVHGSLLREFLFDKPNIDEVTCAAASKLTSIFLDNIASPTPPATSPGGQPAKSDDATQLVIATAARFP